MGMAVAGEPTEARPLRPGELVLARALLALRWAGLVPAVAILVLRRHRLDRPVLALVLVGAAALFTAWATWALLRRPSRLVVPGVLGAEVVLAAALLAGDGWVFGDEATFDTPALGAVWALAAPMAVGLARGPLSGGMAAVAVALFRLLGGAAPEVQHGPPSLSDVFIEDEARLVPTLSLVALYLAAGVGAGYLARLQRRAERDIASARAREEVARRLHDGVLQTLAIIQRRSSDAQLARLARDTDRDLRAYLAGVADPAPSGLAEALRAAATSFAHRFDFTPQLNLDDGLARLSPKAVEALAGAVGEALANVGKHASASKVTVYAGPDERRGGILVSVKDNGRGFDPAQVPGERGLMRSLRQPVEAVGGEITVRSSRGAGTEVRLWVP